MSGTAGRSGVRLAGARIDALVASADGVLLTSQPAAARAGIAQVRRDLVGSVLSVVHLVFAPLRPRPLLFGVVSLRNRGGAPLVVDYTEIWDVAGEGYVPSVGAARRLTEAGARVLADVGVGIRARPPEPPPARGLALDLRLGLAPGARRQLFFAYAAPGPEEDPANLVRAWRGDVAQELARTVAGWSERLAPASDLVDAYRVATLLR